MNEVTVILFDLDDLTFLTSMNFQLLSTETNLEDEDYVHTLFASQASLLMEACGFTFSPEEIAQLSDSFLYYGKNKDGIVYLLPLSREDILQRIIPSKVTKELTWISFDRWIHNAVTHPSPSLWIQLAAFDSFEFLMPQPDI